MKKIGLSIIFVLFSVWSLLAQPRYIFYFIGDGMGPNEILLTEMYRAEMSKEIGRIPLHATQFPYSGQLATYSESNGITDSSAARYCTGYGRED